MSRNGLRAIMKHVNALRPEEQSEDSWFVLPDEADDDVNWMDFVVEIEGPNFYDANPASSSSGAAEGGAEGGAAAAAGAGGDADAEARRPSPYAGGLFRLQIHLEADYPMSPPKVKFNTKVWHPNVVHESGELCMDFLSASWKSDMTLRHVLLAVRSLLAMPNADDHVNGAAAREMKDSVDAFDKHAAEETAKHAMD